MLVSLPQDVLTAYCQQTSHTYQRRLFSKKVQYLSIYGDY